jgi:DNA-binding CsgD family transcriptional regulator
MGSWEPESGWLLERTGELAELDEAVAATAAGAPRTVLLEGPAGSGKTALLRAACRAAERAGFQVLAARGGELERAAGLGVARQLFEPTLVRASAAERAELLAWPAAAAGRLFGLEGTGPASDDELAGQNALYWLCARLAGRSPLVIAIDDLHWADLTSLRWVSFLVRRLEDHPVLVVLARRTDEQGTDGDLLTGVTAEPVVRVIRPGPLSSRAVEELARGMFGCPPQDKFVLACHQATGGNPLFTLQLLETARAEGLRPVDLDAAAVAGLAPKRVSQLIADRLRRLRPAAVAVAELTAVLGADAEVRHVRALSGLTERQVLAAGDELSAAGLVEPGQPFCFVHPVIRSGSYEAMPAGRRAEAHGRAARLLAADGAEPARVAMHVLKAPPAGDPGAVRSLRAAAAAELSPETKAAYLRRAVAEPAAEGVRPEVLLELGRAESLAFDPGALDHLREALRTTQDPCARALAAAQLAWRLNEDDERPEHMAEARQVLRSALAELSVTDQPPGSPDREALLLLHVGLLDCALEDGITRERLLEVVALADQGSSPAELELLGVAAYLGSTAGASAGEVADLARRALRGCDLSAVDSLRRLHLPVWALEIADRLDDADHWLLRIQDAAGRCGSPSQIMLAASTRAELSVLRGALADAEQDARMALELAGLHERDLGATVAAAALVMSLTEQGRLAEAEAELARAEPERAWKCDRAVYFLARGRLRMAQLRAADALADFSEAGRLTREGGHDFPGFWPWRAAVATAHGALGHRAEAAAFAREEVERIRAFGAPGPAGVALRTLGLALGGPDGIDTLAAAVAELDQSPALLERAKGYLELGAARRRAGHRTDSRESLRQALDLADRCGAVPVARRAREELLAAGGRPRRTRIGGVKALTASELRVARRAAAGRTNRDIAQELFVSVKAVEKHLASAYQKLRVQGRGDLAAALGEPAADRPD